MHQIWTLTYAAASPMTSTAADARRLTNLALAAVVSGRVEGLGANVDSLKAAVSKLALGSPPKARAGVAAWLRLLAAASGAGRGVPDPRALDGWVEAFQSASAERKSLGAYATPFAFADVLAESALEPLGRQAAVRLVDPACGAGALLLAAHRYFVRTLGCDPAAAAEGLHGVEVDPVARELCVLLLWIAAGPDRADLARIASNVVVDNAITRDWWTSGTPFDALIMNPPWESLRDPKGAGTAVGERDRTLARLGIAVSGAADLPPLFSAHGRGDRNLFKAFVELAPHLLRRGGRLGALVPAAFASDDGMTDLRRRYLLQFDLERWTGFENRRQHFAIDTRYKFGLLFGTRSTIGTQRLLVRSFSVDPSEVAAPHVLLKRADMDRIGGHDCVIPELGSERERRVLVRMLDGGTPFFGAGALGSVRYRREVDLTLGRSRGSFRPVERLGELTGGADAIWRGADGSEFVPVLEGRMVGQYDCFQKSWASGSGRRAVWQANGDAPAHRCRPQFVAPPQAGQSARIALCDVTSSTNTRTILATAVPPRWLCGNTAPVLVFDSETRAFAGLAVLNSMVFDWLARRVVSGLHVNKFYLARLVWPRLDQDAVKRLATAGRALAAGSRRGGVSKRRSLSDERFVEAHVGIETEVAGAFGLAAADTACVLSNDGQDRRGMWRHFEADPRAVDIAATVIAATRAGVNSGAAIAA